MGAHRELDFEFSDTVAERIYMNAGTLILHGAVADVKDDYSPATLVDLVEDSIYVTVFAK